MLEQKFSSNSNELGADKARHGGKVRNSLILNGRMENYFTFEANKLVGRLQPEQRARLKQDSTQMMQKR